jgi:Tol biopolymer transport system component
MMNPDGTDIQQITSGEYWHINGSWSPDAERIVCNTEEGTTTAGISMVVMDSDGGNRTLLGWGRQMSWSSNGSKIAFIYSPSAELGLRSQFIYTTNYDGSDSKRITNDSLELIYSTCWSSDGNKIYFSSNRHNTDNLNISELYYMDNEGNNVTRLTYTQDGSSYSASIAPSGDRIVFMSTSGNAPKGSIYLSDINWNTITLIISPPDSEIYNYPRWSPDEESIIFIGVTTDGNSSSSVYKIGIDGKNLIKLVENACSADWSK